MTRRPTSTIDSNRHPAASSRAELRSGAFAKTGSPQFGPLAALVAGCTLALAPATGAQTVLPPDPRLDYLTLDFGTASTFLTGIRGANITGNSVIPGGQTGGLYYDSASESWLAFPVATPNRSNYPGAIGSSPYGPSFGSPGGVLRVVGSYKTDAAPVDLGYLYDGAAAPGTDPLTLVYPDADTEFTIAHSTFGDTVVGNYDTGPLTGNAFIYDIPSGTYVTNNRRGAISTTAYGVWGDKIAGGYGAFGPDREPGFEHGYVYDMRTGRWTTHDHPDAVFTHFEGITGAGRGGAYNLVADWIGAEGLQAAVLHIDAEGLETWIPIAFPGADVTTANSIHQDRVIGVYTDATGTHGFEVTIPGIYDPIANAGDLTSSADNVTLLEGAPGDDVVNSGDIVTTGDFANAIRVDRYGVVYNSGTIQVSGATAGAVALRGAFPSLINTGVLKAASAGDAVRADANASGSLIVNTGVIDGRIDVRSGDSARFENSGLIGLSEAGAGVSSVVSGVFVQTAAGAYAPRVGGDAADSIAILGTARLAGALNPAVQPGALVRDYTLLTVTGIRTGRFDTFAPTGLPDFVSARVDYSADTVDLALTAGIAGTAGLTDNERGVADALDDAFNSASDGGIPDALNAAIFALSPGDLPQALGALSGELYASEQAALIDGAVFTREAILGRLRQTVFGVGGPFPGARALAFAPTASPATGRGVTLWGQALGARIDARGGSDASKTETDFTGVFGGADMRLGARGVIGFAAGYTWSDTTVGGGGGAADADSLLVAGYGGASNGPWSLRAGVSYAMNSIDATRDADFPGFAETLDANYDATTAQIFGEVGYAIERGPVALEPFLGLAWVHLDADGFTETGGEAALSARGETSTVGYSTLGVRAARSFETGLGEIAGSQVERAMTFTPHLSLAWRHAWGDLSTSASLSFAEMTAQGFDVGGVAIAEDTGLVDLGFDLAINSQATLGLAYLGQFSNDADANALRATLAWAF